jgi:uncharacterized protein (DUF58 family)
MSNFLQNLRNRFKKDESLMTLTTRRGFLSTTYLGFGTTCVILILFFFALANNLWYYFSVVLFGLCMFLYSLIISQRMGRNMIVTSISSIPEHAGKYTMITLGIRNYSKYDFIANFEGENCYISYTLLAKSETLVEIPYCLEKRGLLDYPTFLWVIFNPTAMTRSWGRFILKEKYAEAFKMLAYPSIYNKAHIFNPLDISKGQFPDYDEMSGLREYRTGDNKRDISWKASSRNNRLVVVERPKINSNSTDWIRWADTPSELSFEDKCSVLAKWIRDYEARNMIFGLELPHKKIGLGSGKNHVNDCLKELALMKADDV